MKKKSRQQLWLWRTCTGALVCIDRHVGKRAAAKVFKKFDGKKENAVLLLVPEWCDPRQLESVRVGYFGSPPLKR